MNYVIINFQSQNTTITVTDYDNASDNSHESASGNNTTNSSKPSDDECGNLPVCTLHNTFFCMLWYYDVAALCEVFMYKII